MCGINGFITKKSLPDWEKRIRKMNNALFHRGPDAGGYNIIETNNLVLGQRRLSIIDIDERSNQPMWSHSRKSILVFNGEIYNYDELKNDINYPFHTCSDTEVLLAGLEQQSVDFINKCNGMFGIAFYNSESNKLYLIRDRMGIKPLYYYKDNEKFIFSSEIKGILNSGLIKVSFNESAIDEYLGNRYVREPYTFFNNIYQLSAGCYLELNEDFQIKETRYWDLPETFILSKQCDEDIIFERFKVELTNAIKRRMIADVPIGTYLSGGIDSSIISAVCALNAFESINTYTIGFPELNEFSYARQVAEKYSTNHHEILIDNSDYFSRLKELISYKDAPLGVPNEVPLAIMSKKLKKNITVVLSGEGADELMGGYGRIFRAPFDYKNIDAYGGRTFYDYFIEKYEYVPRMLRDKYLNTNHYIRDEKDNEQKLLFSSRQNEENIFKYFHQYHVKGLLQRVDMTTMYASVEARVPFLDHQLIEFTYNEVPYDLKLKWNSEYGEKKARRLPAAKYSEVFDQPKYLVRRMGLELLPEEVVTRKKMGFPVPLNKWFSDLQALAEDVLGNSEWFNSDLLPELINDCKKNEKSGQLLWMFINVELFRRMYFEKQWRY